MPHPTHMHPPCPPTVGVRPSPAGDGGRRSTVDTAGQQLASLVVPISDERLIREDHAYYRSWSLDRETYLDGAIVRLTARGVAEELVVAVVARLEPVATDRRAA